MNLFKITYETYSSKLSQLTINLFAFSMISTYALAYHNIMCILGVIIFIFAFIGYLIKRKEKKR